MYIPITTILLILLGSDDYRTREFANKILDDTPNIDFIILTNFANNTQDLEIKTRISDIIHTHKIKQYRKVIGIYPILPQLDMLEFVEHKPIFWGYRTQAIFEGYKSYKPTYMACRRATYLYFEDLILTDKIKPEAIPPILWKMYKQEFYWYIWFYCDLYKDKFHGWHKPNF